MDEIRIKAYGKVNLGLDVTGRRDDGYHLVRMIMQTVRICDLITIRKIAGQIGQEGQIILSSDSAEVPLGKSNIAWKAADKLICRYGISDCISIHIEKNIPVAAGMAGGSTDAAAVIRGMNELFELEMSAHEMDEAALELGADVPFCLRHGTYLAEGIGEILTKIEDAPDAYVLVVNPPFEVSTAFVYRELDALADPKHPDIEAIRDAIREGSAVLMASRMGNILAQVTEPSRPQITDIREKMIASGAAGSMMTGSGPTVFGLYTDRKCAEKAFEYFTERPETGRCFLTEFVR